MKNIFEAPFVQEMCEATANMYRMGWDERNGGNISYMLDEKEVGEYLDLTKVIRTIPTGFDACGLIGKIFIVTGTGKYFKNVQKDPETNLGIVRIAKDGTTAELLWGYKDGGKFTSEFPAHMMSHMARLAVDPEHRVVMHSHPTYTIAMNTVCSTDEKEFTHKLWQSNTEAVVVFPDGVGVLPCMICGTNEIGSATAEKMKKFRLVVWTNHGIYGTGKTMDEAFGLIETVEKTAQIYMLSLGHVVNVIPDEIIQGLADLWGLTPPEGILKEQRLGDDSMQKWIKYAALTERSAAVVYRRKIVLQKKPIRAELQLTATGVYVAEVNGVRISDPLAPGCDTYKKRHQFQRYNILPLLSAENEIRVTVGSGWFGGRMNHRADLINSKLLFAVLHVTYSDGSEQVIESDGAWTSCLGAVKFSDIWDGEEYDATLSDYAEFPAEPVDYTAPLIEQDGERILEQERIKPVSLFVTPKGERVLDFGQNLTGYVEFTVNAVRGQKIVLSCAEVLDKDGNFYNENYRSAKSLIDYTCKDGKQTYKPLLTFFGFRYLRLDECDVDVNAENFTAIVVHSDLKRTGYVRTSEPLLNKLFENIIWGQKGNFLDVPTDCPQRDERLGWTGDAQVFCRTANYNFDCEKFFARWLRNLKGEQLENGDVPRVIPSFWIMNNHSGTSSAWGDAATVCPWEVYRAYGNKENLLECFDSMKKYVDFISSTTDEEFLWIGGDHYGDWLGLDAPAGSYTGSSDKEFISSAFYAYSTKIVCEAGKVLGLDIGKYETLYQNIRKRFIERFNVPKTQTECVLALYFKLTDDPEGVTEKLVKLIKRAGNCLQTGFVGTPYLLHALSENGQSELAYELLLRDKFPSWLYSVKCGATTVWEHWDGRNENGEFWSRAMNSFNHYAYGAVADWIYGVAAGISPEKAGYEKVRIAPCPTDKIDWLDVEYQTRQGLVRSKWYHVDGKLRYEIETPTEATVVIEGKEYLLQKGKYVF